MASGAAVDNNGLDPYVLFCKTGIRFATPRLLNARLDFPRPRPEILVSATVALTGFTEDNGATRVVPGSNHWEPERKPEPHEIVSAVMPCGSALLYSGNVLHGGGANRTSDIRIGCYVGYLLSWLRPIENHAISNGVEVLAAAPSEVQRLLDYVSADGFDALA